MPTRLTQSSFTRGELSPRLDARTQLEQYAIGLKTAKNALIHQEGGISNRMGLEFCGEVKYSNKTTRVMKFVFNSEQTYMLEFGDHYIRFLKDGGYIIYPDDYGVSTGIETVYDNVYSDWVEGGGLTAFKIKENPDDVSTSVWVYCETSDDYIGVDVYLDNELTEYYGYISVLDNEINGTVTIEKEVTIVDEDKVALRGHIVEKETPYAAEDLMNIKRSQSGDVLTLTHFNYPPKNLTRYSHYDWELEDIVFKATIDAPTGLTATFSGTTPTSNQKTYSYVMTAVDENNSESERSEVVECVAHREANWAVGETITVRCEEVLNANEYNVYRNVNGLYGYIGTSQATEDAIVVQNNVSFSKKTVLPNPVTGAEIIRIKLADNTLIYTKGNLAVEDLFYTDQTLQTYYGTCTAITNTSNTKKITLKRRGVSFVDDNIEPDLSSCAPVIKNPFENNNNPSCSCYFQQRKIYANSYNDPQVLWASQTGTPNNFNVSRPLIATDAVTLAMDDREMNEIRHLIPMKDLIVLTSNSEWKANGTDGIFQANPAPAVVIQSCYGASHVEPVVSGNQVIFVQSGGSVIRDLGYEYLTEGYDGDELSLFSSHLFEGKVVVDMAYAKEPNRLLFVILDDGSCALMTYNKKQKLCGWTRIVTDGKFLAVDTVREGLEDVAYVVIERVINGSTVKYIERTKTRIITDVKDAFLVDSGLDRTFTTPTKNISGLNHLEGKTVIVNGDGGIITDLKVQNGAITLPKEVTKIVVGLPYEFEIETLNIEGENTQGLKKLINYVSAKIFNSREDFIFCGANNTQYRNSRCDDSINNSGHIFSKDISSTVLSLPDTNTTVKVKQDYPLPLTILSLSAVVDVQDNENE